MDELYELVAMAQLILVRVLRPVDVWLNTRLFGRSPHWRHNQTISQLAALKRRQGHLPSCVLCSFLNVFQWDHCERSLDGWPEE